MVTRHRRPPEDSAKDRTGPKLLLEGETLSLEEFWNAMADEVEAMSNEELRAELAPLKVWLSRKIH